MRDGQHFVILLPILKSTVNCDTHVSALPGSDSNKRRKKKAFFYGSLKKKMGGGKKTSV